MVTLKNVNDQNTSVKFIASHASHVLIVPFTNCRHIGHFLMAGAQSVQQQRWPQGNMAMEASFSIQILHIISSFNCLFSSSKDCVISVEIKKSKNKLQLIDLWFLQNISMYTYCRYFQFIHSDRANKICQNKMKIRKILRSFRWSMTRVPWYLLKSIIRQNVYTIMNKYFISPTEVVPKSMFHLVVECML